MQSPLPPLIACAATALAAVLLGWIVVRWLQRRRKRRLPEAFPLTARPVFSTDERRVYRQLHDALPQHVVLSKLALVRFCQPDDPHQRRYWYGLLSGLTVSFAICSGSGRVLAAIDLKTRSRVSRRGQRVKEAVLAACEVRYLRCDADELPSIPELQTLVRSPAPAASGASAGWRHIADTGLSTGWDSGVGYADSFVTGRATRGPPAGDDGEPPTGTHGR